MLGQYMTTKPKPPKRYLTLAIWFSAVAAIIFMGIYLRILFTSYILHPPVGWQNVSPQLRYQSAVSELEIVLDLLPVAAFGFMILAYLIWSYMKERKAGTDL
jgi:hypothetical protein